MDPTLSFQFVSDFHIELIKKAKCVPKIKPLAPILVLAGDICNLRCKKYEDFLSAVCADFQFVLLVPGNHEFYQSSHPKMTKEKVLKGLFAFEQKFHNLVVMHKREFLFKGIRFLGTTLWTDIPECKQSVVQKGMNDYACIYNEKKEQENGRPTWKRTRTEDTVAWHKEELTWLIERLVEDDTPTVVITHHLPSESLITLKYKSDSNLNCAYYTNLEYLMDKPIICWIFGHSHSAVNRLLNQVLCVSNCLGYPNESIPGYNSNRVISVKEGVAKEE